jgi:SAM-dependent methyltransferase
MTVDYHHFYNLHSLAGAKAALPYVLGDRCPRSLLDVGCGIGTWVRAAMEYGIGDVCGVDGVDIAEQDLLFPKHFFRRQDLTQAWNLGRRFDIVLCLEVVEHLASKSAITVVETLTAHSEVIVFSAACPGQTGQHHVNCQWPEYWQRLFNKHGYVCDDSIRWKMWDLESVEPWYRQNAFVATRAIGDAGNEPRIKRVIHPEMLAGGVLDVFQEEQRAQIARIEAGQQSALWYLTTPLKAYIAKIRRRLGLLEGRYR